MRDGCCYYPWNIVELAFYGRRRFEVNASPPRQRPRDPPNPETRLNNDNGAIGMFVFFIIIIFLRIGPIRHPWHVAGLVPITQQPVCADNTRLRPSRRTSAPCCVGSQRSRRTARDRIDTVSGCDFARATTSV